MSKLLSSTNDTTIAVSAGDKVTGVLLRADPYDPNEVSFAYSQPTDDLKVGTLLYYQLHVNKITGLY